MYAACPGFCGAFGETQKVIVCWTGATVRGVSLKRDMRVQTAWLLDTRALLRVRVGLGPDLFILFLPQRLLCCQ